jgi:hypothetical protein
MERGYCLDSERNGVSLRGDGEAGPGPPERGKDRQLGPGEGRDNMEKCSVPWERGVGRSQEWGRHFWGRGARTPSSGQWASDEFGQGRREDVRMAGSKEDYPTTASRDDYAQSECHCALYMFWILGGGLRRALIRCTLGSGKSEKGLGFWRGGHKGAMGNKGE